uniref:Uncharacterized protein n=1 Tax=Trepomonas sp. PC1 TaxID=1076344 RepID=A0A146JZG5_9EUKA|eukprot:JAP90063.1 Hypothetical protein TPC1_30442 [Trepomonas sp. PC1]
MMQVLFLSQSKAVNMYIKYQNQMPVNDDKQIFWWCCSGSFGENMSTTDANVTIQCPNTDEGADIVIQSLTGEFKQFHSYKLFIADVDGSYSLDPIEIIPIQSTQLSITTPDYETFDVSISNTSSLCVPNLLINSNFIWQKQNCKGTLMISVTPTSAITKFKITTFQIMENKRAVPLSDYMTKQQEVVIQIGSQQIYKKVPVLVNYSDKLLFLTSDSNGQIRFLLTNEDIANNVTKVNVQIASDENFHSFSSALNVGEYGIVGLAPKVFQLTIQLPYNKIGSISFSNRDTETFDVFNNTFTIKSTYGRAFIFNETTNYTLYIDGNESTGQFVVTSNDRLVIGAVTVSAVSIPMIVGVSLAFVVVFAIVVTILTFMFKKQKMAKQQTDEPKAIDARHQHPKQPGRTHLDKFIPQLNEAETTFLEDGGNKAKFVVAESQTQLAPKTKVVKKVKLHRRHTPE